jgi:hypothetical protein
MSYETESDIVFKNLSCEEIVNAEQAINSDKLQPIENNCMLDISCRYYKFARKCYEQMINETTPNTSYVIFAENANGMEAYGLYKSRDGKIYIIESYLGEIRKIFISDKNIYFFRNLKL